MPLSLAWNVLQAGNAGIGAVLRVPALWEVCMQASPLLKVWSLGLRPASDTMVMFQFAENQSW
jgi:hypothetical protein